MSRVILHVHSRRVPGDLGRVSSALDALWSGGAQDAFPHDVIRPWRQLAAGSSALSVGSQFGHGRFAFTVVSRDRHDFVARIDSAGIRGSHGFSLLPGDGHVTLTHTLRADLDVLPWVVWKTLVGSIHDWAVSALLERLEYLLVHGRVPTRTRTPPPRRLALYRGLLRAARRSS
jgi:hypothetical protein